MAKLQYDPAIRSKSFASGPKLVLLALLLAIVACVAVLAVQVETHAGMRVLLTLAATVLGFASVLALLVGVIRWGASGTHMPQLDRLEQRLLEITRRLESISDGVLLSDAAKRIVYRQNDRAALRQAIQEDLDKGDFDAARVLVEQMAESYGYREEAEQFREQIQRAQTDDVGRKLDEAIERLDDLLRQDAWDRAFAEVGRIQRMFPQSPRVEGLERRVQQGYDRRKHELERQFLTAAERDDLDLAMSLMKQLDRYLSEEEAEPFRETARGVIGKKRDNLGVQFKLAVHDKEWARAIVVGEQIMREFPNTKMAQEVRGMMELLRQHVVEAQA